MKKIILTTLIVVGVLSVNAQQLLTPTNTFSHRKTAYITLIDGTEIQGTIDDIDRKKGMIVFISIIDGNGKTHNLKPEKVNHMYLPPSGLDKLQKTSDLFGNVQKWYDDKLNQDLLSNRYVYFELSNVKLKKENRKLLMQLLNPSFSKVVKVYYDPFASESGSFALGGLKVVGGISKSYFIAKGNKAAFKLKKKNYANEFIPLWKSCNAVIEKYQKPKWRDLTYHIIAYSDCSVL